jgi:hypothetical protein
MRLTVLQQTAKGLPDQTRDEEADYPLHDPVLRDLERLKQRRAIRREDVVRRLSRPC